MDFINLKSLNLTAEESEDLIKLLPQKRGITTKKLLSTIKLNLKRKDKKETNKQTSSNTRKIKKPFYNIDKKINNTNDDFIENIRDLFNTNVDKKINNTNDEDFIENIKDLFNNKLDKKINNNNTNDDYIENIRDLFSILDYEPVLIKSGFDNNYLEYISNGND